MNKQETPQNNKKTLNISQFFFSFSVLYSSTTPPFIILIVSIVLINGDPLKQKIKKRISLRTETVVSGWQK